MFFADHIENRSLVGEEASKFCDDEGLKIGCRDAPSGSALIAKLEAQQVRKAMASLPVPFREVLVLREIHELDYRTIAEVAALPIGTVMSRLARARRLLAAAIAADTL